MTPHEALSRALLELSDEGRRPPCATDPERWTVEQTGEKTERGQLWRVAPPDELPDEILTESGSSVSSGSRQPFRQPETGVLTCEDVETTQNPDELTDGTRFLSVEPEQRERERGVPDSSSVRQFRQAEPSSTCPLHPDTPHPETCWTCETGAAS